MLLSEALIFFGQSKYLRPQIGHAPIRGLDLFKTEHVFEASDRSISYLRPLSVEIEIIQIRQDLDEIWLKYYKVLIGVYLIQILTDLDDLNFYRKGPRIGNAPIRGIEYNHSVEQIQALDRKCSYPRPGFV